MISLGTDQPVEASLQDPHIRFLNIQSSKKLNFVVYVQFLAFHKLICPIFSTLPGDQGLVPCLPYLPCLPSPDLSEKDLSPLASEPHDFGSLSNC